MKKLHIRGEPTFIWIGLCKKETTPFTLYFLYGWSDLSSSCTGILVELFLVKNCQKHIFNKNGVSCFRTDAFILCRQCWLKKSNIDISPLTRGQLFILFKYFYHRRCAFCRLSIIITAYKISRKSRLLSSSPFVDQI